MKSNRQAGTISSHRMPYDEAVLYCMTSNENGHNDWRLPLEPETSQFSTLLVWCDEDIDKDTENEFFAIPVRTIDD